MTDRARSRLNWAGVTAGISAVVILSNLISGSIVFGGKIAGWDLSIQRSMKNEQDIYYLNARTNRLHDSVDYLYTHQ